MRRRLIRAGIRNENALKILYGAKAAFGIALPLLVGASIASSSTDSGNKIAAILAAVGIGFFGPNEYVRKLAAKRQHEIARACPTPLTFWSFASRAAWVSIRPSCRSQRSWNMPIRRSAKSSASSTSN